MNSSESANNVKTDILQRYMKRIVTAFICISALFSFATPLYAQELHDDFNEVVHGKVLEVLDEEVRIIPGTDTEHTYQTLRIKLLSGEKTGQEIEIENDYLQLEKGDRFYANHLIYVDGSEHYIITNIDRRMGLIILLLIFVIGIIIFGRWQGVRSLIALIGSFVAIFYILIPGILNGWNPLFASSIVATVVLFFAIFFTHGFNRISLTAFGGTLLAVIITTLFAVFAVHITSLSGFSDDSSIYLNLNTGGNINFTALLLGAIIIGILGVLDDIAITQAAVVNELYSSNPNMSKKEVYTRAIRVGKEHVGALVNTLVLAYTGVSLPLLLLFKVSESNIISTLNMELFATEIVRTIVGSLGLILTVPIVTLLATLYLHDNPAKVEHSHHH